MRRIPFTVIAALAVVGAVVALGEGAINAATPTAKVTISASRCAGGRVFCFKPAPLTVKSGTKVIWTNRGATAHTVTRCSKATCGVTGGTGRDAKFASPTIGVGKTYAFTFHKRGTYRYFCKIHGYAAMHGTITVK